MADEQAKGPEVTLPPLKRYNRQELPDVIDALYATDHGSAGGCLHIVLDDGNTEAGHVAFCAHYAAERACQEECFNIALSLLALPSRSVRDKVIGRAER